MKYVVLLALAGLIGWSFYQRARRKLRIMRGLPEPEEYKAPRSVKLLAAAIVIVYVLWIMLRLLRDF